MFRTPLCPSSGASQLHMQSLVPINYKNTCTSSWRFYSSYYNSVRNYEPEIHFLLFWEFVYPSGWNQHYLLNRAILVSNFLIIHPLQIPVHRIQCCVIICCVEFVYTDADVGVVLHFKLMTLTQSFTVQVRPKGCLQCSTNFFQFFFLQVPCALYVLFMSKMRPVIWKY